MLGDGIVSRHIAHGLAPVAGLLEQLLARRVVGERLGITFGEMAGGHLVAMLLATVGVAGAASSR